MAEYNAGDAKLRIVPDASNFKKDLETKLRAMQVDFAVKVDMSLAQAKADLTRFREQEKDKAINQSVNPQFTRAREQMAAFRADQRANAINVPVSIDRNAIRNSARAAAGDAKNELSKIGDEIGKIFSTGVDLGKTLGITALIANIPAAVTAVAELSQAIEQLSGAALVVPGAIGGIVASVGTLIVGLSGIKEAYSAVSAASEESTGKQAEQAKAAASATTSLRNAVVDEAQAQKDVARARKDARQQLQDLNLELRGGALNEAEAVNDLAKAKRDYAKGGFKDAYDRRDGELRVYEAEQRLDEARQRNVETQAKVSDANAKGVEGSDLVTAAKEREVRSTQAVGNAQQSLAQATGVSLAAADKAAAALAKLSPQAAKFVDTLIKLKPQWVDLKKTVSGNLFEGADVSFSDFVAKVLPNLKTGMGSIATAWNSNIKTLLNSLGSDNSKGLLDRLLGNTAEAQNRFNKAIDPLVRGIGTLVAAGSDSLPRIADAIGNVAERFANFIDAADKDGRLAGWIDKGLKGFADLGKILLNVGESFHLINQTIGGQGLLANMRDLTDKMVAFLGSTKGQNDLKNFFAEGKRELDDLKPIVSDLIQILPDIWRGAKNAADVFMPVLREFTGILANSPDLVVKVTEAFVGWSAIKGVVDLTSSLRSISGILEKTLPESAKLGAAGITSALGPVVALIASIFAVTHGHPEDYVWLGPNSPGKAAQQGQWGKALFGDAWGPISRALGLDDGAGGGGSSAPTPPGGHPAPNDQKLHPGIIYRDQDGNPIDPSQVGGPPAQVQQPAIVNAPLGPPIYPPPPPNHGRTFNDLKFGDKLPPGYQWDIATKAVRGPDKHLLLGSEPLPDGYADGGPSTAGLAVLHSNEFVLSARASKYPMGFKHALNEGRIDPKMLPHFDGGGAFNPAVTIDPSHISIQNPAENVLLGMGTGRKWDQTPLDYKDYLGWLEDTSQMSTSWRHRANSLPHYDDGGPYPPDWQQQASTAPIAPAPRTGGLGAAAGHLAQGLSATGSKLSSLASDFGGTRGGGGGGIKGAPTGLGFIPLAPPTPAPPTPVPGVGAIPSPPILAAPAPAAPAPVAHVGTGAPPGPPLPPVVGGVGTGPPPGPADGGASLTDTSNAPPKFLQVWQNPDGTVKNFQDIFTNLPDKLKPATIAKQVGQIALGFVAGLTGLDFSYLNDASQGANFFTDKFGKNSGSGTDQGDPRDGVGYDPNTGDPTGGDTSSGTPGANLPGGGSASQNPASRVPGRFGASPPTITPEVARALGEPTLYATSGANAYKVPDWASKLAGKFGLTASTRGDGGTLHQAGYAFDFNPSGGANDPQGAQKMDAFANFVSQNLSGQTLQLIHKDVGTGQEWRIAGGQLVGPGTSAPGYYNADIGLHGDHVHWATDIAPVLSDTAVPVDASGKPVNIPTPTTPQLTPPAPGDIRSAAHQAYLAAGMPPGEWNDFDNLIQHESSWSPTAGNPSGAYGLGQFLPGTWATVGGSKTSDPMQQLAYIFAYLRSVPNYHGSPAAAWALWQQRQVRDPRGAWYDLGGILPPGLTLAHNATGQNEMILNPAQTKMYQAMLPHFYEGGDVEEAFKTAAVRPPPPKPALPARPPDARQLIPRPSAPSIPSPAIPKAPAPATGGAPAAPAQQLPGPPEPLPGKPPSPVDAGGPAPVAPGPSGPDALDHNLKAIDTGIDSAASTIGNIASQAIAAGMGGEGIPGGGAAGQFAAGLIQQGGKIAKNVVNIGSSFLVGNVTPGTADSQFGEPNRPAQRTPESPQDNRRSYIFNGIDSRNVVDDIRLKDAQDSQATLARFGG